MLSKLVKEDANYIAHKGDNFHNDYRYNSGSSNDTFSNTSKILNFKLL